MAKSLRDFEKWMSNPIASNEITKIDDDHNLFSINSQNFLAIFPDLEDPHNPIRHTLPSSTVLDFREKGIDEPQKHTPVQSSGSNGSGNNVDHKPKYRKRRSIRNHQKKEVIQVSAEGLIDMWSWRKYGQKPIKGTPYPRSYYKCSSSKGCMARKLVEQKCNDPGMFVVTYTAEHSHGQPVKRNALARTVRQKFGCPNREHKKETIDKTNNREETRVQEEIENQMQVKLESPVDFEFDDLSLSDQLFNDEFFSGMEELDDFLPMESTT